MLKPKGDFRIMFLSSTNAERIEFIYTIGSLEVVTHWVQVFPEIK